MQNANRRCTDHATMSTEHANDRLITVHAPFLAIAPNQNATFCSWSSVRQIHNVRTIVADCLGLYFLEKKRKRNVVWEFAKMFETMVGVELLEGYKRAVCDTCRYSIFW